MQYEATLKYGNTYNVFGISFQQGIPGPRLVSETEREYLEQNAIKVSKTTEGERLIDCAFDFKAISDEDADGYDPDLGDDDEDQTSEPPTAGAATRKRAAGRGRSRSRGGNA
jgi:hypothetical protein